MTLNGAASTGARRSSGRGLRTDNWASRKAGQGQHLASTGAYSTAGTTTGFVFPPRADWVPGADARSPRVLCAGARWSKLAMASPRSSWAARLRSFRARRVWFCRHHSPFAAPGGPGWVRSIRAS
jgi:hypothetical protein